MSCRTWIYRIYIQCLSEQNRGLGYCPSLTATALKGNLTIFENKMSWNSVRFYTTKSTILSSWLSWSPYRERIRTLTHNNTWTCWLLELIPYWATAYYVSYCQVFMPFQLESYDSGKTTWLDLHHQIFCILSGETFRFYSLVLFLDQFCHSQSGWHFWQHVGCIPSYCSLWLGFSMLPLPKRKSCTKTEGSIISSRIYFGWKTKVWHIRLSNALNGFQGLWTVVYT